MNGLTENYISVSRIFDASKANVIEKVSLSKLDKKGEWVI